MNRIRGMSLIDVVVGIGLMLVLFLALFGLLRVSLTLSTLAKAKASASALMETQIEYLRGLSYDALGTSGGIPSGNVPQYATSTVDGVTFVTYTYIAYVDDPADGLGASDTNGITTDYKVGKVAVYYYVGGIQRIVSSVSNFAPVSIETSTGGGTLQVNVVNKSGAAVSGATVQITNASTTPTINLTAFSNSAGAVLLGGAATSSSYQVSVGRSGYSSAQTYARAGANQNPTPGFLTVVKNQTTTGTFVIDLLASLTMQTFSVATTTTFFDTFAGAGNLATTTNTQVSGGAVTLSAGQSSGLAISTPFHPSYLSSWGSASATLSSPASTTVAIHIYDGSGTLLPDAALAGNATGFTSFPINLSGISTTTYTSLSLGAALTTSTTTSPSVLDWTLTSTTGPAPLPNISFTLTGAKTIGTTSGGAPIYKTTLSDTTGATGSKLETVEWDAYSLALSGYDIVDACSPAPYSILPGSTNTESLYLTTATSNSLFVSVSDSAGNPVSGATVTLTRTGFSASANSSTCGNAYFGAIASSNAYTITIAKTGYTTTQFTSVNVSGQTSYAASFP